MLHPRPRQPHLAEVSIRKAVSEFGQFHASAFQARCKSKVYGICIRRIGHVQHICSVVRFSSFCSLRQPGSLHNQVVGATFSIGACNLRCNASKQLKHNQSLLSSRCNCRQGQQTSNRALRAHRPGSCCFLLAVSYCHLPIASAASSRWAAAPLAAPPAGASPSAAPLALPPPRLCPCLKEHI